MVHLYELRTHHSSLLFFDKMVDFFTNPIMWCTSMEMSSTSTTWIHIFSRLGLNFIVELYYMMLMHYAYKKQNVTLLKGMVLIEGESVTNYQCTTCIRGIILALAVYKKMSGKPKKARREPSEQKTSWTQQP